ncbi:kinase domain-containing protein [Chaetomium strumarium]|uniref:non-specific serine/threonine protein kinase n=1 Tax=Chaetomium strumarium TaxID=1170767 RepID=A0AAJ0GX11_9PEZI|nr:kinase domain-containing protein [Chaetomium strumarium]
MAGRKFVGFCRAPTVTEEVYIAEVDLEDFEEYSSGGYHPTVIGDTFCDGRYELVHKLGFGGYSTIWLAKDKQLQRYVSLKILIANEFSKSTEAKILPRSKFIPRLLDEFSTDSPNGHHVCLEDSSDFMFQVETARSIAAQLIKGLSYLHSQGVCHDLHVRNFLICGTDIDHLDPLDFYRRYRLDMTPVRRVDGTAVGPHAPPYAVYPLHIKTPANSLVNPVIRISDFGTSFVVAEEPNPALHTPDPYRPPEAFFNEPITLAADIWTLRVNLYEILGERCLFETFFWDRDDIIAEIVNTLGLLPKRWWEKWEARGEFFEADGSWRKGGITRIFTPKFRRLHQRMWDMGRGETPKTCQWDVEGGEMRALEELLRGMMAFEPSERLTAEEVHQWPDSNPTIYLALALSTVSDIGPGQNQQPLLPIIAIAITIQLSPSPASSLSTRSPS